ncbi:flagellin [candidate division KSB1 bacterium]
MAIGDFTRIKTNIAALNALNALKNANRNLETTQLRLATGKRITSVAVDPAGYVISTRINARTRGLAVAVDNIGTAKNMLAIAEGGLQNISDILITMKEKITQAASDTLSSAERNAIKNELDQLTGEIDDIVEETTFNRYKLLNGTFINKRIQTGARPGNSMVINLSRNNSSETLNLSSVNVSKNVFSASGASEALAKVDSAIEEVSDSLQKVGAYSSRLNIKENTLNTAIINNKAAASRIEDADLAREQLKATKYQILQRTSVAQLVQANLSPINILYLFRRF